jgi:gentisate 1,2-dioxygenase
MASTRRGTHLPSSVYRVAEGGCSVIEGQRCDCEEADAFVVAAWAWREQALTHVPPEE